jgi:hypothetical protein
MPPRPIPESMVAVGLLASFVSGKFLVRMPLCHPGGVTLPTREMHFAFLSL